MPNLPREQTWRRKVGDARIPTNISRQQAKSSAASSRCNQWVVVTVLQFSPKRCLPSLNYCSGCIRFRYIRTAWRGLVNDVARYQGSRCPWAQ